ncbi:MAG: YlxR family protein [Coriobacteriia bacterium]|nr:YlxR family protein [Coriobacteriia bacterium]
MGAKASIRTCVICRRQALKSSLLRIVRTGDGQVLADTSGRLPGRGAYICVDKGCLAKAQQGRQLGRALGVELDQEAWEGLERVFLTMCP